MMSIFAQEMMAKGHQEGFQKGIKKGHKKGLQKGRQEGRQEGRQDEAVKILLRQLNKRFHVQLPPRIQEQIQAADLDTLENWSDRVVEAHSLEEVFDFPPMDQH